MDLKSKRFWVAQAIAAVMTVAMFMNKITITDWITYIGMVEGGWGALDTAGKFADKKGGGSE